MPKKIPELNPASAVTDSTLIPIDSGTQSFKATGAQLKTYTSAELQNSVDQIQAKLRAFSRSIASNWLQGNQSATAGWSKVVSGSPASGRVLAIAGGSSFMTSDDGVQWTTRTITSGTWNGAAWSESLGLYVAVRSDGTGNRVATSPQGTTWTLRTSAADNAWNAVCWSEELGIFVAVAETGTANRVMTSPDGINWTSQSTSGADRGWRSVCWSPDLELFVAVAVNGDEATRVMTSPDGITWTLRTTPTSPDTYQWETVVWCSSLGLFVAGSDVGSQESNIMTSPDGITWTARSMFPTTGYPVHDLAWSESLGVLCAAIRTTGFAVSTDAINWFEVDPRTFGVTGDTFVGITWSDQLGAFVAVANSGSGGRVARTVPYAEIL